MKQLRRKSDQVIKVILVFDHLFLSEHIINKNSTTTCLLVSFFTLRALFFKFLYFSVQNLIGKLKSFVE